MRQEQDELQRWQLQVQRQCYSNEVLTIYKKTALGFPQRGTDALHREKVADHCKTGIIIGKNNARGPKDQMQEATRSM